MYSRRQILRAAALTALSPRLLTPSFAADAPAPIPPTDGFRFVLASDLHYRDRRCGAWLERVTARIRQLRPAPAFCVLDGDLTEGGRAAQLGAVKEIFERLPMPIRAVVGNHDCTGSGDFSAYRRIYGASLNYGFAHGDWDFLALDSTEGPKVYRARIGDDTLAWVDGALKRRNRNRPLIILTHLPLGHNWLRPLNAQALLNRLHEHDLRAVLSGHWHGMTETKEGAAELTTGRCCSWWRNNHDGSQEKGFTLCELHSGQLHSRFVPVPVPAELLNNT